MATLPIQTRRGHGSRSLSLSELWEITLQKRENLPRYTSPSSSFSSSSSLGPLSDSSATASAVDESLRLNVNVKTVNGSESESDKDCDSEINLDKDVLDLLVDEGGSTGEWENSVGNVVNVALDGRCSIESLLEAGFPVEEIVAIIARKQVLLSSALF